MKDKKKMKRGMGEILGFCYIVPFIIMLICAILSSAQITVANQKLVFSAYSAARAAVIAETEPLAKDRAEAVLKELYGNDFTEIEFTKRANGIGFSLKDQEVRCTIEYIGEKASWIKGDVIKCTVYQKITPLMPFTSGIRSQSVVMMIEHGELSSPFYN